MQDRKKLGNRQTSVLHVIEQHFPITNRRIAELLNWPINTVTPRCLELRAKGKVMKAKTDMDAGRRATFWKPVKQDKEFSDVD